MQLIISVYFNDHVIKSKNDTVLACSATNINRIIAKIQDSVGMEQGLHQVVQGVFSAIKLIELNGVKIDTEYGKACYSNLYGVLGTIAGKKVF